MLKALQRFLTLALLILGGLYLLYQGFLYWRAQDLMPPGMTIAGVDVAGMTANEASEALQTHYFSPFYVKHVDEEVALNPADVGFVLDVEGMLQQAIEAKTVQEPWRGYVEFVLARPFEPINIPLRASHDPALLAEQVQKVADFLDRPPQPPSMTTVSDASDSTGELAAGLPGYTTDVAASLPQIEQVLYQVSDRVVPLVVTEIAPPEFNRLEVLKRQLEQELQSFSGIGSIFVMDLQTGEELSINGDVALSGLSILKIGIFLETYRALDAPPDEFVQQLLYETAVLSSNYSANQLLHIIAGENNTYEGAADFTAAMQRLGLKNTFMAIPYDAAIVASRPSTMTTPANSVPNLITLPDSARQTTAEDMGTLLSMIYYCAKGGGALLALYPDQLSADECQAILDLMVQNTEGNLIRFGVPEDVPVSHKHGWGDNLTLGDAGIVFSSAGDYVIVTYVHDPATDFIVYEANAPYLWEMSRTVYNFFNPNDPYLEDVAVRVARDEAAQAAAEEAAAQEAEASAAPTAVPTDTNAP